MISGWKYSHGNKNLSRSSPDIIHIFVGIESYFFYYTGIKNVQVL